MDFAAAISRASAAVARHLDSDRAVLDHVLITGTWISPHTTALDIVTATAPAFNTPTGNCMRTRAGSSRLRTEAGGVYTVVELQPDGAGRTTLVLQTEKATPA